MALAVSSGGLFEHQSSIINRSSDQRDPPPDKPAASLMGDEYCKVENEKCKMQIVKCKMKRRRGGGEIGPDDHGTRLDAERPVTLLPIARNQQGIAISLEWATPYGFVARQLASTRPTVATFYILHLAFLILPFFPILDLIGTLSILFARVAE